MSAATPSGSAPSPVPGSATAPAAAGMRRELRVGDAAAFSVGLIGPVGVMALLGAGAAGILGRGAVWAFVFALVAVALVAYGFVKLSRHVSHTGSVYALVGVTLGPRAGFVAGWSLFFAYVTIGAGSGIEIGFFLDQLLGDLGSSLDLDFALVFAVVLVVVVLLARREIHVVTRSLLTAELVGAALVVLLDVVVLVRLATGSAPGGRTLDAGFLALPSGTGMAVIAAAAVFGFLAFAGFEGAAALGEETREPRRDIPRAIVVAIVVVGAFYLLTIVAQSLGYGTDAAGVEAFAGAGAPYGDLGTAYVGPWLGDLLTLAAVISLFAIFLGTLSAAGRILFALARDSGSPLPIARLSSTGAPSAALAVAGVLALVVALLERVVVSSGHAERHVLRPDGGHHRAAGGLRAGHRRGPAVPVGRAGRAARADLAGRGARAGPGPGALHDLAQRGRAWTRRTRGSRTWCWPGWCSGWGSRCCRAWPGGCARAWSARRPPPRPPGPRPGWSRAARR